MTKIGLLPFYVKLYDKTSPQTRVNMDKFKNKIVELLTKQDVLVSCADICCVKDEFQTAVDNFEKEKVDCIYLYQSSNDGRRLKGNKDVL